VGRFGVENGTREVSAMNDIKFRVVFPRVIVLAAAGLVLTATAGADEPAATRAQEQPLEDGGTRIEKVIVLDGPASAGTNRYMIPAAAHAEGLEETQWVTDVVIHNPGESAATVNAFFLKGGRNNHAAEALQYQCEASTSMLASDMVLSAFGESSATGGILVGSESPLFVSSRTYNTASSGTYGQYVPGLGRNLAVGPNDEVRLIQLTRNTDYRTNIGFSNDTGDPLRVWVDVYRANSDLISYQSYDLQPYGYFQATDIIGADVPDAYAVVSSVLSGANYFTYASVVDNRSGDPVLVLPSESAGAGEVLYVPAAAHVTGIGGTNWRTDLEVHNPGSSSASYRVELLKRNRTNDSPIASTFSLSSGESSRYEDTLQGIFGFGGTGALRVTPTSGEIIVTSRTYNDVPSGTYGQFVPAIALSSAITEGQAARLIQLSYSSSDTSGFRTNIGFVNTTGSTVTASVELYAGSGELLGTRSYSLMPYEYDQVTNIFSEVADGDVDEGYAIVTTTAGGRLFAYASVVDNRSGDPVYIPTTVQADATSLPPFAPDLTASATSSSQIDLRWSPVSLATGFTLYRGSTMIYSGSNLSYEDTWLSAGTEYCYTISAKNPAGDGPLSAPMCATTHTGGGGDEISVTLPGGVPLVMVHIPAGTFMMGSPTDESGRDNNEDLHQVTLTRDYYIGKVEITQAQWQAVMGSNPASGSGEGDDHPVYFVSWEDIAGPDGFIERLNQHLGTDVFRLPTEAEWERAVRAGTQTRFSHGDADECDNGCGFCNLHDRHMVWCGNASDGAAETGSKLPNAYGLHNVNANVAEWVQDWYGHSMGTSPQTDPTGPTSGPDRVVRGGCWLGLASNCRSATRRYWEPYVVRDIIGFRLAKSAEMRRYHVHTSTLLDPIGLEVDHNH